MLGDTLEDSSDPDMLMITLGPDGQEVSNNTKDPYNSYVAAKDGIGYGTQNSNHQLVRTDNGFTGKTKYLEYSYSPSNLTDLARDKLTAYDVKSGNELWNYTFSTRNPRIVTMDAETARTLIGVNDSNASVGEIPEVTAGSNVSQEFLQVFPGNNVTYANFRSINFEYPIVPGKSKCAYINDIYAFDENGTLLWVKDTTPISSMQVMQNGTIFYQTPGGNLGVTNTGFALGFTVTTLLYLFLRFFCVGAVARAKSRLDRNENRNLIFGFIMNNPGLTMCEISRGTSLNPGTVRYHILVLRMNRKIIESKMDNKYIRYFTNSNSYSKEDQLIISLMRRDSIGRVLGIMLKKPGISNREIAKELNMQESVVSRYVKELYEKGIVTRVLAGEGYTVYDTHKEQIAITIKRIYGE